LAIIFNFCAVWVCFKAITGLKGLQGKYGSCKFFGAPLTIYTALIVYPTQNTEGSVVGLVTMLRDGGPGVRIPVQARDFSLLQNL
jgi:hypothetical protein